MFRCLCGVHLLNMKQDRIQDGNQIKRLTGLTITELYTQHQKQLTGMLWSICNYISKFILQIYFPVYEDPIPRNF